MRKFYAWLLAVIIIASTAMTSVAASSYNVRVDNTVYSPGAYMTVEITAALSDLFTIEILKGSNTLMSLPAEGNNVILKVLIPANWGNGTDYVLRVGRGSDIASVGFEVSSNTGSEYGLSIDKTTVKTGDTLILSGTSNIANSAVQYSISASGVGSSPKTGNVIIENNNFECFVDIDSTYAVGTYTVKVGSNNVFSNVCTFTVTDMQTDIQKVASIIASPQSSKVDAGTKVTLSTSTPNATIYYTLNETTPTKLSNLYTNSGITINSTTTLKAIAIRDGYQDSEVLTQTYTVGSGGGSLGGGGGGGSSTTTTTTIPAADGAVQVDYSQSGGTVTLTLPTNKVSEIIGQSNDTAVFDLSGLKNTTTAILPKTAFTALSKVGLDVEIRLPEGMITLSGAAAVSVAAQAASTDISVELKQVQSSSLNAVQRESVKSGDTVIDISILSGTQKISTFDGELAVTVPYSDSLPVAVWYLNNAGELEKLNCTYDATAKTVSFTLDHLSLYVLGRDTDAPAWVNPVNKWVNPFSDVKESDWFYTSVEYAVINELFSGTSATTFSPNTTMTRGMMVTVLWRMAGSPAAGSAVFTDIPADTYYAAAVAWATENGIVNGMGDNQFAPVDNITREQMAVMLYNYAQVMDVELPEKRAGDFADEEKISAWAKDAVNAMYAAEILSGKGGNNFDPQGNATRAEVATMYMNFLEAAQ